MSSRMYWARDSVFEKSAVDSALHPMNSGIINVFKHHTAVLVSANRFGKGSRGLEIFFFFCLGWWVTSSYTLFLGGIIRGVPSEFGSGLSSMSPFFVQVGLYYVVSYLVFFRYFLRSLLLLFFFCIVLYFWLRYTGLAGLVVQSSTRTT